MSPFLEKNPGVKVDVFAICYNEEFLLPRFIEHYQKVFGAAITIFDNYSTDRSREIAAELGCNVRLYDSGNQVRDDIYLKIKNNCWKYSKADWVIVCDIDEFLEVDFDITPYTLIGTLGYDIVSADLHSRFGVYNWMMNKYVMFRPNKMRNINYQPGCHKCSPDGEVVPSKEFAKLLHRKYISPEYVYNKHLACQERLSDINKKYGWGTQYMDVSMEDIKTKFEVLLAEGRCVDNL